MEVAMAEQEPIVVINYQTFDSVEEMLTVHLLSIYEKSKCDNSKHDVLYYIDLDKVYCVVDEDIRLKLSYLIDYYVLNYPDIDATILLIKEAITSVFPIVKHFYKDYQFGTGVSNLTLEEYEDLSANKRSTIKNFVINGTVYTDGEVTTPWVRGLLDPNYNRIIKSPAFRKTLFYLQEQSLYSTEDLDNSLDLWLLRYQNLKSLIVDAIKSSIILIELNDSNSKKSLKISDLLKEVK